MKKRSGNDGEHLDCPICLECLKFAVETSCGHCFCAACITQYLKKRYECPVCRRKISSVHPSYTLRRVVEAHLKRESISFEEGYQRKQREADAKLSEVFESKKKSQTNKYTIIGLIGIVLVIAIIFGSGLTTSNKKTATTTMSPEQQIQFKKLQEEQQPPPQFSAHPNSQFQQEESRLGLLASGGDLPSLIRLLEGTSQSRSELSTALIDAARGGHHEVVKLLLKHGADPTTKKCAGLVEASREGHFLVVSTLLEAGAHPNSAIDDGLYAIHFASEQGHTSVVKKLLDAGAAVNSLTEPHKFTPLYLASRAGHAETVKVLLKRGAIVDAKSAENATPLYVAAEYGRTEVVKLLQGAGASIETYMQSGATPLVISSQKNYREIVEFLLRKGAKTGVVGANKMNSLHLASTNGHVECVRMLLESAASTDEVDADGNTALHHAVFNVHKATKNPGNSEIGPLVSSVSLLLRHGANPNPPPNNKGETVESYVRQTPALTRAFSGVKRIECKIIPANTMDSSTILPMNTISTLHEVILRVEHSYLQRVSDIATSASGEVIRVSELDATTTFLSEIADSEGVVVIRVFFKKPLKS